MLPNLDPMHFEPQWEWNQSTTRTDPSLQQHLNWPHGTKSFTNPKIMSTPEYNWNKLWVPYNQHWSPCPISIFTKRCNIEIVSLGFNTETLSLNRTQDLNWKTGFIWNKARARVKNPSFQRNRARTTGLEATFPVLVCRATATNLC